MATARQRVRMAAIRSALDIVRKHQRHFTSGCGLVVFGGATTPDTTLSSDVSAITDERSDYYALTPPQSSPPSYTPPVHRMVVSGGAIAPTPPLAIPFFGTHALGVNFGVPPRRIFPFPPLYPHFIDAFALVVLGRFWLWHRAGVG